MFGKISYKGIGLLLKMSVLSNRARSVFEVLLFKIKRKGAKLSRTGEPTEESNPFQLKYVRDIEPFGISRNDYTRGLKELSKKGFIEINGSYDKKLCKILVWY